jgi:hypothetical protein
MRSLEGIDWPAPLTEDPMYPWHDRRTPAMCSYHADLYRYGVDRGYSGHGCKRGGGQFHSWIAVFDLVRRLGLVACDDRDNERLDLLRTLNRSCGWWEPYQRVSFVTERPAVVRIDAQLRLHCPDAPAITFRDGWSVYAGRRFALHVPPRHTDPIAAAAELYGWARREYAKLARRA